MQIKHLEYFVAAAECGSINQAARALFLSPQALSSAIAGLERELGFRLFTRKHQGVSLTAEGRQVFEDAKNIIPITEKWLDLGKQDMTELAGEMSIYVSLALAPSFNRFLIGLEKDHPKLSIALNEDRGKNIVERMKKGGCALALCSMVEDIYEENQSLIEQNQWAVTPLMEDEMAAVLGRDYFPQIQGGLSRADCGKMTLICSSDASDIISRRYLTMFGGNLTCKVESHASILYMVEQNQGVIILPRRIALCEPMYKAGLLRILPIEGIRLKTTHYMIHAKKYDNSPITRAVMELIRQYYARAGWEKHDYPPGVV